MNQIGLPRVSTAITLAAALAAGGCVSQGSYDKLAAEKDGQIAALQLERTKLEYQARALRDQIKALDADRSALERQTAQLKSANEQAQAEYKALAAGLNEEVKKGELQVRQYKDMLTVDVAEQVFFDSGRADLKRSGRAVLEKLGQALKGYDDKVIRVVGHTDNVPIAKPLQAAFSSNWELSVARATAVVRHLQQAGVPPERMIASGRAEYDPVADNATEEGRKKNRRIEITLLNRSLVQEAAPGKAVK